MTKVARVLLLNIAVLTCSMPTYSQNCSYGTMTLASQHTDGGCGPNSPFAQPVTIITTKTFNDVCSTTSGAASNPGTQYYSVQSSVTGSGACELFVQGVVSCPPNMVNSVTQATGPDDYNRFYNQAYDTFVNFDSNGSAFCDQTGGFHQDFQQCAGQACSSAGGGGSGGGGPVAEYNPGTSPIILDIGNEGFHLTSAQNGVIFDIRGDGNPIHIAWTDPHFRNAFLTLPGPDGLVHSGKQLFGNFTPQPPSDRPNGFLALAQFDKPENGGNGDGVIDIKDAIFSQLRLWIDDNHDGICQPIELHTLPELGVSSISLRYHFSRMEDQYGNVFRYRSRVNPPAPSDQSEVGKTAYDVFFTSVQ